MGLEKKSAEGAQAFPQFLSVWKFKGEIRALPVQRDYPCGTDERMYLLQSEHEAILTEDAATIARLREALIKIECSDWGHPFTDEIAREALASKEKA